MARKYVLVPASQMPQSKLFHTGPDPHTEHNQQFEDVLDLVPKSLKHRAKTMLHYLKGHLVLSDSQRVIYSPNEPVGSHILDLLRYVSVHLLGATLGSVCNMSCF